MTQVKVPQGVSGLPAQYDSQNVTIETLSNELVLSNLGDFEPLNIKIDTHATMQELVHFNNDWIDYLPRTDRPNNRKALTLTQLPGKTHRDSPSLAEACHQAGRRISELEFNHPTEVFERCYSLQPFLNQWQPLGRTFIVQSNIGGYFVPHRDHPSMPRDVFRLIVFLNNVGPYDYDWLMGDKKINIEPGRVYYVNTRREHRTISWVNNSLHLILNIPFTGKNVAKVVANLQHTH